MVQVLSRAMTGPAVEELQLRLAGFRGTRWDGFYGPDTELQVITFQKDYMKMATPSGICDNETFLALERFAKEFPIDFQLLRCPCQQCQGFGKNQFKDQYLHGKPPTEANLMYEYPGLHKAILHTYRAAQFYAKPAGFDLPIITSGYRCWNYNRQKGRNTTNHLGKALDIDFPLKSGEDKRDDTRRCDAFRILLSEKCYFQLGWNTNNIKSLEPSNLAPTWVHLDVRCYDRPYLADRFFVKSLEELDSFELKPL